MITFTMDKNTIKEQIKKQNKWSKVVNEMKGKMSSKTAEY